MSEPVTTTLAPPPTASSLTTFGLAPPDGADRPVRYLHLIAEVAASLLAATDMASMVDETFALIQDELKLHVYINYRFDEADGALILEAHGGLDAAQAEDIARLEIGQAVCGSVARDRQPVHATHVQSSGDPITSFVKAIGLDAYACTPLLVGQRLLGTLSFGRRWTDHFEGDELQFLRTVCHYVALAKYRLGVERELRDAVDIRERLLVELNHRVRNSLQLVTGLVALEAAATPSLEGRTALRAVGERIFVVAAVHQRLYVAGEPDRIEMGALLKGLAADIGGSARVPVAFDSDEDHWLPVEKAVALALAFDELLRPRLLNRSPDDPGIAFHLFADQDDRLCLRFSDPYPVAASPDEKILTALARQLRATWDGAPAQGEATLRMAGGGRP